MCNQAFHPESVNLLIFSDRCYCVKSQVHWRRTEGLRFVKTAGNCHACLKVRCKASRALRPWNILCNTHSLLRDRLFTRARCLFQSQWMGDCCAESALPQRAADLSVLSCLFFELTSLQNLNRLKCQHHTPTLSCLYGIHKWHINFHKHTSCEIKPVFNNLSLSGQYMSCSYSLKNHFLNGGQTLQRLQQENWFSDLNVLCTTLLRTTLLWIILAVKPV